ncbi:MAG: amidophosphoribosyltransferase [Coriobacteriales bacterium]|jgi:amidophosphoribosyltransferase|nr:amidophosphoribosyltransferase [Coriobacteriales bacterium]
MSPTARDWCLGQASAATSATCEAAQRPDRPEEACAVFGIYAPDEDVSRLTYFGLHALQHRGQESAGIATGDGGEVNVTKDIGLVTQVFGESSLAALTGHVAIGHTRYSTSGGSASCEAAQPHFSAIGKEIFALAHNGTLVNSTYLRAQLINLGISFRSFSDSEVAAQLIGNFTKETGHMREGIRKTMQLVEGAYSMVLLTKDALYAFRDPNGMRPLSIGRLPGQRGWVVASETCGLDIVGANYVRDVMPGEVVRFNGTGDDGFVCESRVPQRKRAFCVFEFVYFARPDSCIDGQSVYQARDAMGRLLASEAPAGADIVIGVPDSGVPSAIGYAAASKIPYVEGIIKNRYVGRTFIQPTQLLRERGIRLKLNPLPTTLKGQRVIVVDDSIVRGNTSRQLVQMLREAGAREVHMRIVSPPVVWPCFYGIDTDTQDQLIAANLTVPQIGDFIGVDSLSYLSHDGLLSCINVEHPGFCTACFSGSYPIKVTEQVQKRSFCGALEPTWQQLGSPYTEPLF